MLVSFQALVKGAWPVYYAAPVPCLKQLTRCTDAIIIVLAYAVMHDVEIDGPSLVCFFASLQLSASSSIDMFKQRTNLYGPD
jgi:hypothetical protein